MPVNLLRLNEPELEGSITSILTLRLIFYSLIFYWVHSHPFAYVLAEFDSSVSQLCFATYCVISYTPEDIKYVPVHSLIDLFPEASGKTPFAYLPK